jgi:hypothetical protein
VDKAVFVKAVIKTQPTSRMNNSQTRLSFRKTAACPTSSTLLSYCLEKLSRKLAVGVGKHLTECEFCSAELGLLAHHTPERRGGRPPEIPMNLRILAESLLCPK